MPDARRPLLFVITHSTEDPDRAATGLEAALAAAEAGHQVALWLTGEGVRLGVEAVAETMREPWSIDAAGVIGRLVGRSVAIHCAKSAFARRDFQADVLRPGLASPRTPSSLRSWPRAGCPSRCEGTMFTSSIEHYDRIYSWKDYRQETERLLAAIEAHGGKTGGRLLDVACGTGKHLEHLRGKFHVEGLDLAEEFLEIARRRCPGVPFHVGDMTRFDLGRTFDVVTCLFSSIGYAKDLRAMRAAVHAMAKHVAPGGLLVVEPWFPPDKLRPNVPHMNVVDLPDLKICRMNTTIVEDRIAILEMHHLVGTPKGTEHFVERHELFCATVEEVQRAFTDAGLKAFHEPDGMTGRGLHVGRKPKPSAGR